MKRPASASMKRQASASVAIARRKAAVCKKPAKKLAQRVLRRPAAAPKETCCVLGQCKPIAHMSRADFAFFLIPGGKNRGLLAGCKSPRKGYIFEHLDFNSFADKDTKVPSNAQKSKAPDNDWISAHFWNPSKRRLVFDGANLPERASGKAYRIEDSDGGMPFVCYVRDDAVSVFQMPKDGYIAEEDEQNRPGLDKARLVYTEEVITIDRPEETWVSRDNGKHGHGILVHTSASKGKCLTATIKLDEDRQLLQVACTDLVGSPAVFVKTSVDSLVGDLPRILEEYRHSLYLKCVDENGKEVAHNQPLKGCSKLVLQDATQSYVYIGDEIYSFDSAEKVTAYFSMMTRTSMPCALTKANVMWLPYGMQSPRIEVAPYVKKGNWGGAYINPSRPKPLANRREVTI